MRPINWLNSRSAGVLLHPTCLPGGQGIGTLGDAERFLDFLEAAGMGSWQICPLGPTGYGDSPYQCFSAFAGNPYLIDMRELVERGLLSAAEIAPLARLGAERVDFGALYEAKPPLLALAWERYRKAGCPALDSAGFGAFKAAQAAWLDDYAAFRAFKDANGGRAWVEWPEAQRNHAKAVTGRKLADACEAQRFQQYVFHVQWARVRASAARRGISIIGDVPIFVAADSADAWSHPELFELDPRSGRPLAVAGVPPDYFSADGQLWGNPLYTWERHRADGYAWWLSRMRASFSLYDIVRIDHFRGFDEYWRIPLPAQNARKGEWMPGPRLDLFNALGAALPGAKIIAEDLGDLTPSAFRLRDDTGFPGMAILQFAFGGDSSNLYLPHNLVRNSVIYPGTHDNDTSLGWYAAADEKTRDHARRYLRVTGREIGWDLIRAAYGAVCRLAVIPLADILSAGPEGRFNTPGKAQGNWQWRVGAAQLESLLSGTAAYLRDLGSICGRAPPR